MDMSMSIVIPAIIVDKLHIVAIVLPMAVTA